LDPEYPADRLAFMIHDADLPTILTQKPLQDRVPVGSRQMVCIDADWDEINACPATAPGPGAGPDDPAYLIYTSGSTGMPKGAVVTHRNVVNLLTGTSERFEFTEDDVWTMFHSLSFDFSVWEIWGALSSGGRLVIVPSLVARSTEAFLALLQEHRVSVLNQTPTAFRALLKQLQSVADRRGLSLRLVIFGGEALDFDLVSAWKEIDESARFVNMYGITETTVHTTWHVVGGETPGTGSVIGEALPGVSLHLLDGRGMEVPVGVAGELFVGGAGVARGYLGRPGLTASRFVPDEFSGVPGARLYRTGDRVRRRSSGELEFLGRVDDQVKVRGHRIELGEIEACLRQHSSVDAAVVMVREDVPGVRRLVAYVTPVVEAAPAASEMRSFVSDRLPGFMVPSVFVVVEALPVGPTGKVDRKALPVPDAVRPDVGTEFAAPRSEIESVLAQIWADVLGVDRVGVEDNFFELGGDSILSIQIVARAGAQGVRLSPRQVFQHQTVAELSAAASTMPAPAEQGLVSGEVLLTPVQRWFFSLGLDDRHHFNQSVVLEVSAEVGPEVVERVLGEIIAHHDGLRSRFEREDGIWRRWVDPDGNPLNFTRVDVSQPGGAERALLACQSVQTQFDLSSPPLMSAVWLQRDASAPVRMVLVAHHLVVDTVSWRVLIEDLERGCEQALSGQPVSLGAKTTSIQAWAERLDGHARSEDVVAELEHWLETGRAEVKALSLDHPTGTNREGSIEVVSTRVAPAVAGELARIGTRLGGARIEDVLLAALTQVLCRWTGGSSMRFDLEGHGREDLFEDVDLSRTVGWFTTIFPVVLDSPSDQLRSEHLEAVRSRLRSVPRRGIGYGLLRWGAEDEVAQKLSSAPGAEVSFNYLGRFDNQTSGRFRLLPEPAGGEDSGPDSSRSHVFAVDCGLWEDGLRIDWSFSRELHDRTTVETLAAAFEEEIRLLVEEISTSPSEHAVATGAVPAADGDRVVDFYPVTPLQEGMLFHSLYTPEQAFYLVQSCFEINGPLEANVLSQAWAQASERYGVLRSSFKWRASGAPVQVEWDEFDPEWGLQDWRDLAEDRARERLRDLMDADRLRGLDVTVEPLMRFQLIRVTDSRHWLLWTHHHALLDGWSVPLVMRTVLECYESMQRGHPIATPSRVRPFRDFVHWLGDQDLGAADAYWRRALAGAEGPTSLNLAVPTSGGGHTAVAARLNAAVTEAADRFLREKHLTLSTLVQGAWALLLARYSGESDVLFGTTVSGRPPQLAGVADMVGSFINTLPTRITVDGDNDLVDWLRGLQLDQAERQTYEYSPLHRVQSLVGLPAGTGRFESIVVVANYPDMNPAEGTSPLTLKAIEISERTNYPVTVGIEPGDQLTVNVSYDRSKIDEADAEQLAESLCALLEGMITDPARRVGEIGFREDPKQFAPAKPWESTPAASIASVGVLHGLVEGRAVVSPGSVAVVFGDRSLSYGELNARANRLALFLRGRGVGPEVLVGVCLDRSVEMVVALLGVLKAGGAYVPLDPEYPADRLAFMIHDAGLRMVLTQQSLRERIPFGDNVIECITLDDDVIADFRDSNLDPIAESDHSAYVIYTSGSTGKPKGVTVAHRTVTAVIRASVQAFGLAPQRRVLQHASLSFDNSVWEIFMALSSGATLFMGPSDVMMHGHGLGEFIRRHQIDFAVLTPSVLSMLDPTQMTCLSTLLVGGEALSAELAQRWSSARELYNTYGPTEASIHTTYARMHPDDTKPSPAIGLPNTGIQTHVLDGWGLPVPVGVAGELFVGGAGVARGYLGRPGLTASRFVPDGFSGVSGARLYRTGDRVRVRAGGELEFLGRVDDQVKLRGHRIELGEVEASLRQHSDVGDAVALVREDVPGVRRLVAYVTRAHTGVLKASELRRFASDQLPAFMVPSVFVVVEALPVGPTGKVDRKALPVPDAVRPDLEAAFVAPRSEIESVLARIWAEVLGVDRVGVEDNFFELGGDSILASRALARIRHEFRTKAPIRMLFEHPTVGSLANRLIEKDSVDSEQRQDVLDQGDAGSSQLTFAQERMWFLSKLEPDSPMLNITVGYRLKGVFNSALFNAAVYTVAARHQNLRSRFVEVDGEPRAVEGEATIDINTVDLKHLGAAEAESTLRGLAERQGAVPFVLDEGPLVRIRTVVMPGEGEQAIVFCAHHIVLDEASTANFFAEVSEVYRAATVGRPATLPPLHRQYTDIAESERLQLTATRQADLLRYWHPIIDAPDTATTFAFGRPRPRRLQYSGAVTTREFDPEIAELIRSFARATASTPFMVFNAAVHCLMARMSGEDSAMTGIVMSQRSEIESEPLIGPLLNLLPVRTDLADRPTFMQVVSRLREATLGTYAHQDAPFEWLVNNLGRERQPNRHPVVQVVLQTSAAGGPGIDLPGVVVEPIEFATPTSKFDITFTLQDSADGNFTVATEYSTELFDRSEIEVALDALEVLLRSAAASPDTPVGELAILAEDQLQAGLLSGPVADYDATTIIELVDRAVERFGNRTAVEAGTDWMTYDELRTRSETIAKRLRDAGIRQESAVACCFERSIDMIVGLLGVLRAGGMCVPLDPGYPEARLKHMFEDSGATVVLAHGPTLSALAAWNAKVIRTDRSTSPVPIDLPDAQRIVEPENGAFVIYTSGSTGSPKGAVLTHEAICNRLEWGQRTLPLEPEDRVLQKASTSFDFAIWECFAPLTAGARVVLAPPGTEGDPATLVDLIRREKVTVTHFVPSLMELVADLPGLEDCAIRHVYGGAEALEPRTAQAFRSRSGARLHNVYGATEVAIDATHWECDDDRERGFVPIGEPISNARLYLLDQALQPVPTGMIGEIYVAGRPLSRGYLHRPGLTAERFVPDPHGGVPGQRMYRTGDLARRHADGAIEYLGRSDSQTKVRGFRVEIGELEAVISRHPAVRQCAVIAEGNGADRRLVGFVVPHVPSGVERSDRGDAPYTVADLMAFAGAHLPKHLVPTGWVELSELPRTPSGKLDRAALVQRGETPLSARAARAPETELQRTLLQIWTAVLGSEVRGVDDDFFAIGGHSLLAVKLLAKIHTSLGRKLSLHDLFDNPTVSELAKVAESAPVAAVERRMTRRPRSTDAAPSASPESRG
jgi:amino acid adenylation domain-containing protein/non-ribosomal peptide synthase protein (TIGR01720 family)